MPSIEKHIELSLERTGKEYRQLHEWLDGKNVRYKDRVARHIISNIPKFTPVVEKKFGEEAVHEFLWHIEYDYKNNVLLRLLKKLIMIVKSKNRKQ